ncbi:hypothetical protein PV328_002032 [Microctonus aethiopoides]|uniref:Uncharacterized protein n=1 Tax=Microctonus aethiopoides TaxID=144406 RepID=A0AA39KY85_9HYME|nr:hypothetical protein PV328_002032 [Microctonus aethiopoides]
MDENVESGQWIGYVKIFLLIPVLSGAILYYVPVSRACKIILDLSRGCLAIIDAIASALIAALNIYEEDNEVRSPGTALSLGVSRGSKSREYEKNSRFNDREVNDDWSTMHFYPDRKCELDRDCNAMDFEWDERKNIRKNDDELYVENDGLNNVDKNEEFHHEVNDKLEVNENKERVRNIRNKIQSIVAHSKKSLRENKKFNVNNLSNNYLKKSSNQLVTKWSRKNASKRQIKMPQSVENDKIQVNLENSRLNRKFTMSTKKELPIKHKRNKVELPVLEIEDLATNSDSYLPPPIITDRVTPFIQSAYQWIVGGCPSSKHKRN